MSPGLREAGRLGKNAFPGIPFHEARKCIHDVGSCWGGTAIVQPNHLLVDRKGLIDRIPIHYLKLERFFELVNDVWVQYGKKVFGGTAEENRLDMPFVGAWKKSAGRTGTTITGSAQRQSEDEQPLNTYRGQSRYA